MKILYLDKENVIEAAQQTFKGSFIEIGECDLFLEGIETGSIQMDGIDSILHVNTNYVYEDRMINGNKTRYKIQLTTVTIKKDAYEIIYDSYGKYFIAYEDDQQAITFITYEDVNELLTPLIHQI